MADRRDDTATTRHDYKAPYTPHHPVPNIHRYREAKAQREAQHTSPNPGQDESSWAERATDTAKSYWKNERPQSSNEAAQTYPRRNKNIAERGDDGGADQEHAQHDEPIDPDHDTTAQKDGEPSGDVAEDTSEAPMTAIGPKQRRKEMKKRSDDPTERTVTDPVTHLPITIHDFTKNDLNTAPENEPAAGSCKRTATGISAMDKTDQELASEASDSQAYHSGMATLFPPPNFDNVRFELASVYKTAATVGLALVLGVMVVLLVLVRIFVCSELSLYVSTPAILLAALGVGFVAIRGMRDWVEKKVADVWDDEVWEAERQRGKQLAKGRVPESTQWLNSLLAAIWPLVNPDLFTSLADTLEDVMQASLPKVVRMVSVDDLGQGSESIRILGVRWLPTGAAAMSVSKNGKLRGRGDPQRSDRTVSGQGEVQHNSEGEESGDGNADKPQVDENIGEGMEAEEGDFVNVEIAFSYRARTARRGIRDRAKNMHLYLAFYLPGNIRLPVWVELHGFVGTMRLRLQLCPDPPFFSLCTLTFLGQPKVAASCIPLTRRGLNIMDLPLISNFVQSSIDAAMAEYVAPKSLTLDLKDMLMGDDFKKDTSARGVIVVRIIRAFGFKEGDSGFLWKQGSTDGYVSVGWAKFSKPLWSTRIIQSEMEPVWDETTFVLVTADELNVDERLRVQLWDSDRTTADDDLGRIELDIKQLMRSPESRGKMVDRVDGFKALTAGETMPGRLEWSVGYFPKVHALDSQLAEQDADPAIHSVDQLKKTVDEESERKLREAKRDESSEIEQQKAQDFKEREDQLLIASPPPDEYPSGIISITIHQITGLELEPINKNRASMHEADSDEEQEGDDLPSSYCTIILNHNKVFRTRTKPKNSQPFFNAGCERFIRDWKNTDIHISVRDSRVHEDDPLLGIVYLPLGKILSKRSQINGFFPLSGGVGYGRARISIVFRSVELQAPREMLGWDYGTLEVGSKTESADLPSHLRNLRLKVRTNLGRGKMYYSNSTSGSSQRVEASGIWKSRRLRPLKLAVRKRYASPMVIEFKKPKSVLDGLEAYGIFWLKDIPDNEEKIVTVTIWKGGNMKRALTCSDTEVPGATKVGTVSLRLTFWSGLSGYHAPLAAKEPSMAQVMEVLDTAHDNDEMYFDIGDGGTSSSSSSSSDDSDDGSEYNEAQDGDVTPTTSASRGSGESFRSGDSDGLSKNGKRGLAASVKDYKRHKKQLHRKNRGLMQWKGPRTLQWMKHKVEHGEQRVGGLFKHQEREPGIETEV
ncbi:C2 calcium-dependent membrane targeting [Macrophomina phaseolina MS6]|uniref:C2 calcium-dependent membrane targeting n=1 Tax=Macrophomina phaseolina (strain MS6) TaxID=1126212 RepID=K2QYC0_MACPH|nr:C2 calcium-dependent membrane targeting [Macrophomina phaseolina MS6]